MLRRSAVAVDSVHFIPTPDVLLGAWATVGLYQCDPRVSRPTVAHAPRVIGCGPEGEVGRRGPTEKLSPRHGRNLGHDQKPPWYRETDAESEPGFARSAEPLHPGGSPAVSRGGTKPKLTGPGPEAYVANEILGLSADELRRRAVRIDPYRTAWIGRVDTIPPQSDERTALIDRGLMLRGFLTDGQLTEIHRVGDLWLRYHEAAKLASVEASRIAGQAVDDRRRERAARKAKKKEEAAERKRAYAERVARRRATEIDYLGPRVSGKLGDHRSNPEKLQAAGLPVLFNAADLASALGIPIPRLRWLAYHAEATERPHYAYFEIPKRSGGRRLLSAPRRDLATAQDWILTNILEKLPTEAPAHGFVPKHSTLTNALPHVGSEVVVNFDLSDFFPTITFPRVRGLFEAFGYSPAVASILALLATESPRRPVGYDGKLFWVAVGERSLPQGASTSPALSNQVSRKLDRRLAGMSAKHGWTYTRYADDLTFSRRRGGSDGAAMLLARVRHIVTEEGFLLHPKKQRIQRRSGRQSVTGIVVNEKPGTPREEIRRLRAILHQAKTTGLAAQNRDGLPHFRAWVRGKIAYASMVDPAKGARLLEAFRALPKEKDKSAPEKKARFFSPTLPTTDVVAPEPSGAPLQTGSLADASSVFDATGFWTGGPRRFEFVGDGSNKFWIVELNGASHSVHFGRIGTVGQTKTKSFGSADEARVEAEKLIREKSGKGYVEKTRR